MNTILTCILIEISIIYECIFIFAEFISPITVHINTKLGFKNISNDYFNTFKKKGKKYEANSMYENNEGVMMKEEYKYNFINLPFEFKKNDIHEIVYTNVTHYLELNKDFNKDVLKTEYNTCITKKDSHKRKSRESESRESESSERNSNKRNSSQTGGYYEKYLKYKTKYLKLKNSLEIK